MSISKKFNASEASKSALIMSSIAGSIRALVQTNPKVTQTDGSEIDYTGTLNAALGIIEDAIDNGLSKETRSQFCIELMTVKTLSNNEMNRAIEVCLLAIFMVDIIGSEPVPEYAGIPDIKKNNPLGQPLKSPLFFDLSSIGGGEL